MKFFCCFPFIAAIFALVFLTESTNADGSLLEPCVINDLACLKKSTSFFLQQTYKGIPAINIMPIDPLYIPEVDVTVDGKDLRMESRNVRVTGLRTQELKDYKMDTVAKSVTLRTYAVMNIESDVTGASTKTGKRKTSRASVQRRVLATIRYNYELKKDSAGVEHYEVGPETITLECDPVARSESGIQQVLIDVGAPANEDAVNTVVSEILKTAYKSAVQNIRAAAKALPATAFFKNLQGGN